MMPRVLSVDEAEASRYASALCSKVPVGPSHLVGLHPGVVKRNEGTGVRRPFSRKAVWFSFGFLSFFLRGQAERLPRRTFHDHEPRRNLGVVLGLPF